MNKEFLIVGDLVKYYRKYNEVNYYQIVDIKNDKLKIVGSDKVMLSETKYDNKAQSYEYDYTYVKQNDLDMKGAIWVKRDKCKRWETEKLHYYWDSG